MARVLTLYNRYRKILDSFSNRLATDEIAHVLRGGKSRSPGAVFLAIQAEKAIGEAITGGLLPNRQFRLASDDNTSPADK